MKKTKWGIIGLVMLLMLTACGKKEADQSKQNEHAKVSKVDSKKKDNNKKNSKKNKSKVNSKDYKMDFAKIRKGDFSNLKGNWQEVGRRENHKDGMGIRNKIGDGHFLKITKHEIINGEDITFKNERLYFQDGSHPVEYDQKDGYLGVSVLNGQSAINRGIYFYPKGTTDKFNEFFKTTTNSQDVIMIWSSDLVPEKIFVRNPKNLEFYRPKVEIVDAPVKNNNQEEAKEAETKADKPVENQTQAKPVASGKLNLQQILNNDFSSLIGTWVQKKGDTFVISGKVVSDSRDSSRKGIVIDNKTYEGYPVILRGESMNGENLTGSKGTFNPEIQNSPFSPIMFVPAGVKITDNDDSDISRDRLIEYFGSEGYDSYAYYRQ